MKKISLKTTLLVISALLLFSCSNPPEPIYKMETKYGWWNMAWCCDKAGDDCYKIGHGWSPYRMSTLQPYVQNDSINKFFERGDWQNILPELSNKPNLVNTIKSNNLKGIVIDSFAVVFLKNRNQPMESSNIFVAFKYGEEPCDKWLGGAGVE